MLLDPFELQEIVSSERYRKLVAAEEARLLQDDSSSSSSDSDSDDSSSSTDSDTSSGSSGSSSSDDEAEGGRSKRAPSSSGSSSSDNEGDGNVSVKKELRRQKRKGRPSAADGGKGNMAEYTPAVPSAAVAATPVRRSSRTMSAGVPVVAPPTVVCKEPTDSDVSTFV